MTRKTPHCGVGRTLSMNVPEWTEPCPRDTSHLIVIHHDKGFPLQHSVALCCFHYHALPDEVFEPMPFDPSQN